MSTGYEQISAVRFWVFVHRAGDDRYSNAPCLGETLPRMLWAGELGSEESGVREHGELVGLQASLFNFGSIPFLGWGVER